MKRPACDAIIEEIYIGVQGWHNEKMQQVRKDFVEEIIQKLPVWELRLPLSEDISKIIEAHLRAMAGGER